MKEVFRAIDQGDMINAGKLIQPMLKDGDPVAQYVYAMYIAHEHESAEDYDLRSLEYIRLAADQMYAPALYRLGVLYQIGEGVEVDKHKAANFFKLAAEGGHELAKISYAMHLFSGSNGIKKDENLARRLVNECIRSGVEGAADLLEKWEKQ